MSILLPTLKILNSHVRDLNLEFDEPTHKYTIITDPNSTYTSVTTFNHHQFPVFDADSIIDKMMNGKKWNEKHKYWGLKKEEIKDMWNKNKESVSGAGTNLHFDIECFMNQKLPDGIIATHKTLLENYEKCIEIVSPSNTSEEWGFFLQFVKSFPDFKPYRTEWTIYHEDLKIAGSIDMVYENADGTLSIYDWKRAKEIVKTNGFNISAKTYCINHLPDANFWHYSLQLNEYKAILEAKYEKKVSSLYLVRLHPNNIKKTFDLIKCADLSEEVRDLFKNHTKQLENQKV